MGLKEELELISVMKKYGMNCFHRLKQRKITDYMQEHPSVDAEYWLQQNRELPRDSFTCEVDVFGWKDDHWGALCIEDKTQCNSVKTLDFSNEVTLHNGSIELKKSAKDLILQCQGSGHLGRALNSALNLDRLVIPVAVVDYNINIFNTASRWAFHDGVMFVNRKHFEWLLNEFMEDRGWLRKLAENNCATLTAT